jgi:hypothetical protein
LTEREKQLSSDDHRELEAWRKPEAIRGHRERVMAAIQEAVETRGRAGDNRHGDRSRVRPERLTSAALTVAIVGDSDNRAGRLARVVRRRGGAGG